MTISEIAEALNISKTAVSFCLNGRAKEFGLRPELEEKVKAYAEAHGYRPNMAAKRLRMTRKEPPVGVVFSNEAAISKFAGTFREVFNYLNSKGREYVFMGTDILLGDTMQTLFSMDVKDVLVIGLISEFSIPADDHPAKNIIRQQREKIAVMLKNGMNLYLANYAFPMPEDVLPGNIFRAGYDRRELQRDFLRRAHAAGLGPVALTLWTGDEYLLGDDVLQPGDMIIPIRWQEQCQGGRDVANYILEKRLTHPVRSVLISNVISAASMIRVLIDAGIKVPEDIAVAAFGDIPLAEVVRPSITTIGSTRDDKTMEMLRCICGEISSIEHNSVIPFSYNERESLIF